MNKELLRITSLRILFIEQLNIGIIAAIIQYKIGKSYKILYLIEKNTLNKKAFRGIISLIHFTKLSYLVIIY